MPEAKYCNIENYQKLQQLLQSKGCSLVAVSKIKPVAAILELYQHGQRDFGENYVQELLDKAPQLPPDIRWHFIGHLQSNKVKYIAPFVHLIHGVDSIKLLKEINKQGAKIQQKISVLLQVHIAQEETKFGFDATELDALFASPELAQWNHVQIRGLMGMASFTEDTNRVAAEFNGLHQLFQKLQQQQLPQTTMEILSMGMSGDYELAIAHGSNMVRIGSMLFGARK